MPEAVSIVRDVPPIELTECLKWLLTSVSAERAQWIVTQLTDRVSRQRTSDIHAVQRQQNDQIQGAAIAILQSPSAAVLLAIHEADNLVDDLSADVAFGLSAVLERLQGRLRTQGTRFLQFSGDDRRLGTKLEKFGFQWIADLVFLVLERQKFDQVIAPTSQGSCVFRVVGDDACLRDIACQVACESFVETKDCCRLSEFRSPDEIVNGYITSPTFDPSLWHVLFLNEQPAACLFLTAHGTQNNIGLASENSPSGAIEISYMGAVPSHRGIGLGGVLLAEATRVSKERNAERMVLAVDQQNTPAFSLYERHGWVQAAGESVWGMRISP